MSVPSWANPAQSSRADRASSSVSGPSGRPNRRAGLPARFVHVLCVLAITLSAVGTAFVPETRANAQAGESRVATVDLNLRAGPSTSNAVLTVIPDGGLVTVTGGNQGGFLPVTFNGVSGFAFADFLSAGASGDGVPSDGSPSETGGASVLVSLNLRSDASTSSPIVTVMPAGATVELLGEQRNGFVRVSYNGSEGWAFGQFLGAGGSAPVDGGTESGASGTATVNASLNLRAGASTSAQILNVLPGGSQVQVLGPRQDGFAQVNANGTQGWVFEQFITLGGAAPSTPVPSAPAPSTPPSSGAAPSGPLWATVALNLRSGPGTTYSVLTVMPAGSSGTSTGQSQNGFWSLNYNGTVGWASSSLLSTDGGSAVQPAPTQPGPSGAYTQDQIIQIIYAAADRYGQPRADMLRVARCESVLDPNAVNAAGGSYGLFQFLPSTWATTPFANENIFDPVASANAAGWMWENGRRNEWVCQ